MNCVIKLSELNQLDNFFERLRCETIFVCDENNKYVGYIRFKDYINKNEYISYDAVIYYSKFDFNNGKKTVKVLLDNNNCIIDTYCSTENEFDPKDVVERFIGIDNPFYFAECIKIPALCKKVYFYSYDKKANIMCQKLNNIRFECAYANTFSSIPPNSYIVFDTINDMLLFSKKNAGRTFYTALLKNLLKTYQNYIYFKEKYKEVSQTMNNIGVDVFWAGFPSKHFYKTNTNNSNFFENLRNNYPLDFKSYIEQKSSRKVFYNGIINQVKDFRSDVYNVVGGRRYTSNVKNSNIKNIFCFGPCFLFGIYNSDENTICSIMQKRLNEMNLMYNVINCGLEGGYDLEENIRTLMSSEVKSGDIVILFNEFFDQVQDELRDCFISIDFINEIKEENWYYDRFEHCTPLVNPLIVDKIFHNENFKSILTNEKPSVFHYLNDEFSYENTDVFNKYIQEIASKKIDRPNCLIGAIEMNANPMTCGHSYLIKKALEEVDYLYVFLLTEEETEIPLDIRRKILQEEVNKYNNVQMLECGRVWGSRVTFPEYFEKEENNDIIINAEKEILIFAKYIAKVLDIKKRFVGSEPNDKITNQFNIQLKQMLSKYGIELIEIPRLSIEGNYIQAGNVRRYIRERNFDVLEKIVTPEALKILKKEYS